MNTHAQKNLNMKGELDADTEKFERENELPKQDDEITAAVTLTRQAAEQMDRYEYESLDGNAVTFTLADIRKVIAKKTKSGAEPDDETVLLFAKMCKTRRLNPWAKDAFLIGYDGREGTTWSMVVSHQAVLKRAEGNVNYTGKESGVVVWDSEKGELLELRGDLYTKNQTLIGGWAKIYRADRQVPEYQTTRFTSYAKKYGYWEIDPGWMIVKCAEAKALRGAFPSDVGGMYITEELDAMEAAVDHRPTMPNVQLPTEERSRVSAVFKD